MRKDGEEGTSQPSRIEPLTRLSIKCVYNCDLFPQYLCLNSQTVIPEFEDREGLKEWEKPKISVMSCTTVSWRLPEGGASWELFLLVRV